MVSLLNLFQSSENPFFVSAFTLANNKACAATAAGVVIAVTVSTAVNCMHSKHARRKKHREKRRSGRSVS